MECLLELRDLLLLLHPEFLRPALHVVPLLDAEEELPEAHVLFKVRIVHICLQSTALIVFVALTCLLVANIGLLRGVTASLLPLDHLFDLLGVPLGRCWHHVSWFLSLILFVVQIGRAHV